MPSLLSVVAITVFLTAPASGSSPEIDNVAAFARLYGVMRFFYPSDAASELDWNRFAVHGTSRVRMARDAAELEAVLEQLVASLGPGIEIGANLPAAATAAGTDEPLVAWRYLGAGFSTSGGAYQAKRTHRAPPAAADSFVTLMQTVAAEALRGRAIRLSGQVRARTSDPTGGAALWLRVDRAGRQMGFFDNMGQRPVRDPEWRSYAIEGEVAADAETVAFGVMAMGAVTADFDDVELAAKTASGEWTRVPIQDAGFEDTSGDGGQGGWYRTGPNKAVVSRPAGGAPQGGQFVRFTPPGPGDMELFPEAAPRPGAHADFELGSGLRARVPLALRDVAARPDSARKAGLDALRAALAAVPGPGETLDVDQRLADVVAAWSVFRHFYPYWKETGVDWDSRLRSSLEVARSAATRAAQRDALRKLVADVRDGHGSVRDTLDKSEPGQLAVGITVIEGRLVVTSSAVPSEAPVGAVVATIDGVPATDRLAQALSLASGSTQWRQVAGTWRFTRGVKGQAVELGIDSETETRKVTLTYGASPPPANRPAPLAELQPGLWYVDLTRVKMSEIAPKLDTLASARGVIFDVRGYPTDAGARILPHLLDAAESDRWMHVAKIVGPFFEEVGWQSFGWDMKPASPRIEGRVVFLTDGAAISYAESVMGYVADRKLGMIVGGATAGTNGNVASFTTPSSFIVSFTGMRVTRHDGHSPHHLVGVRPDVSVAPTLAGIRAGRDEVLERGLSLVVTDR